MSPPPAALETQRRRGHDRSSSFTERLARLLPANREERGHTLRFNNAQQQSVEPEISSRVSRIFSTLKRKDLPKGMEKEQEQIQKQEGSQSHTDPKETTATQQMFADKRKRREQRRSLRESGDFLGVQGANPRTGFWDPSASSTETSQLSEETKKRLELESKDVEEQRMKLEEAKTRQQADLAAVRALKEARKKERAEKKKAEATMRQQRIGRWKPDGNGWSSVAEPHLSPIFQSLAGSPVKETCPDDRLFPMPSAANPTPYVYSSKLVPQDYFGLGSMLSPPPPEQPKTAEHRRSSRPPRTRATWLATRSSQITEPSGANVAQAAELPSESPPSPARTINIQRKPVGSFAHRRVDSTDTIIRNNALSAGQNRPPTPTEEKSYPTTPTRLPPSKFSPFLCMTDLPHMPGNISPSPVVSEATAISYQSVSTNRVQVHQPLVLCPSSRSDSMNCQNNFRVASQVAQMDIMRIPSNSPARTVPQTVTQPQSIPPVPQQDYPTPPSPVQKSQQKPQVPPIVRQWGQQLFTSIPTTTTTGYGLRHPHLFGQVDGAGDPVKVPFLLRMIPLRTSSQKKVTARLSRKDSRDSGDTVQSKNTHISISMFLPKKTRTAAKVEPMVELTNQGANTAPQRELEDIGDRSSSDSRTLCHDIEEPLTGEPQTDLRDAWRLYGVKLEDLALGFAAAIMTATVVLLALVFTQVILGLVRLFGVVSG